MVKKFLWNVWNAQDWYLKDILTVQINLIAGVNFDQNFAQF